MSLIRTLAPSRMNSSAVARPIPRAEPVMIAALPSSSPICARFSSRRGFREREPYLGESREVVVASAGMPEDNADLIRRFYSAFAARDADTMAACYAPDARFSDPVFTDLR